MACLVKALLFVCALLAVHPARAQNGVVAQVAGDLLYVSGLNGQASLWSSLRVGEGATAEVVKELPDLLVARLLQHDAMRDYTGAAVSISSLGPAASERRPRRVVHATRVEQAPRIDGRIDDPAWAQATPIGGFVKRDPGYWLPGDEGTTARIVYDEENLYFAFDCPIPDGSGPVANTMRRDANLTGDDNIQILLDTFNDGQNGVFFFVNPLGARTDLILSNGGRSNNMDWDSDWQARTTRRADGWTAEVAIPFNQLRFTPGDEMVWGINLSRFNARTNIATQLVVYAPTNSFTERYRMADLAELRGLGQVSTRRPLEIKPYILPGTTRDFTGEEGEDRSVDIGADLRYGITSNLSLDLSYKTDFAQVEADQEQTNLAQFSLFFPEKRAFFLEGSNLFDFGDTESRGSRRPTLLFYSRRIGIEEDNRIPILLGTKLTGKEGRTSIGALHVLTDPITYTDDEDGQVSVERTHYSVLRLKRDVMGRSNVGAIVVNKQDVDGVYNRAAGADFTYAPTGALSLQGFLARTWDSETESGNAGSASLDYRGAAYWARIKYYDIGAQFEPDVGFVNRRGDLSGLRRYYAYGRWRPKPALHGVRQVSMGPEIDVFTDRANEVKYWKGRLSIFTDFDSGDNWFSEVSHTYDIVDESFAPSARHPEASIAPGQYRFTSFRTGPRLSQKRAFVPELNVEVGSYYTGRRYSFSTESAFRPSGQLSLELIYEGNWISLPADGIDRDFAIHVLSSRVLYSFSTDFYVKFFTTWNNDDQHVGANALLSYRYANGSDFFLVLDHGFNTTSGLTRRYRSALLKLSYQLDL